MKKNNYYYTDKRLMTKIISNDIVTEKLKKESYAQKKSKESSLENKIQFAQRKCVQNIYPFESQLEKACKAKVKDQEKINKALNNVLKAIDKAAADSIGRIIAEIKQPVSEDKNIPLNTLYQVNLPVDIFYSDFDNFCNAELKGYKLEESAFNQIVEKFLNLNLKSLKSYSERYKYAAPLKQFEENLKILEDIAVKKSVLTTK